MRRLAYALLLALAACFAFAQESEDNPVEVRLEIFVVSEVQGTEQFTPATTARPGQVVEYRLFANNRGETTLPAGTVVVIGPIPEGTTFVPNSATPASDRVLTEFSGDGGVNFSRPPVLVGSGDNQRVVEPVDYDAVRWTLLEPMEPGQEASFFYRVTVD